MKLKKEYLILAAVIFGLSAYLYYRSADRTHYTLPKLPALAAPDVTKVQMARGGETVTLARKDGRWVIEPQGWTVDPKTAQEILEAITGLSLTALVSESKSYAIYELDDERKANVKAWQGDQLRREFDVGKAAPSFRHTFVRPAGDERVFHAQDNISFRFRMAVDDLRDKAVLAFKPEEIEEVRITQAGATTSLTRKQVEAAAGQATPATAWIGSDGRTADPGAVQSLLAELSKLSCEKFVTDRDKASFEAPEVTIELKGAAEHTLKIFAPLSAEDKSRPAVSSGSDAPFSLADYQLQQLMKPGEAYFGKAEEKKQ
jgi:hypothetical protein